MSCRFLRVAILAGVAPLVQLQLSAQPDAVRTSYVKRELQIAMRDGVKLFTTVYAPTDTSTPWPIMLQRTPYSVAPYGADKYPGAIGPSSLFQADKFIFVYQDVRGRFMSEGEWAEMRPHLATRRTARDIDESTDTYDTIEWLVKNLPGNNGRVGMWGISYPGFYVAAALPGAHPALVAASPQAPIADLYMGDDAYHNGAFMLAANFGFYIGFRPRVGGPAPRAEGRRFDYGTPDGYDYFLRMGSLADSRARLGADNPYWDAMIDHPVYDDFWKPRSIVPHLKAIAPAVLTVGGWFDAEDLAGPLAIYRAIERNSPGAVNTLVMGPWPHGGWARGDAERLGNLEWGAKTGPWFREQIEFPFFAHHLKGRPMEPLAEASVFVTGRNEWRRHDAWPPRDAQRRTFYFADRGGLEASAPTSEAAAGAASKTEALAFDEYVSDPNRPVPYLGYTAMGMRRDYMTEDQRFASTRPDVLVYETAPLDADLTIVGPVGVSLHVSTSGTDADWVVKVIDAYPGDYGAAGAEAPRGGDATRPAKAVRMGGYQQLVRGEPFRGRFRHSFEKPEPFVPGRPDTVAFTMPDVYHVFRKGHRLMVQVQSSWFPLVDRNPQTFVHIPTARPADFVRQTHRVYRDPAHPSRIELQILP
jgi:putative CocE/NonD family hydrolase